MLLRLLSEENQELTAISATSIGYRKLHFEFESRNIFIDILYKYEITCDMSLMFVKDRFGFLIENRDEYLCAKI